MNWKEFFKPNWKKIIIFILLLVVDGLLLRSVFMLLTFPIYFLIFSSHGETTVPIIGLIIGIIGLIIWYIISCLIFYIYENYRGGKK